MDTTSPVADGPGGTRYESEYDLYALVECDAAGKPRAVTATFTTPERAVEAAETDGLDWYEVVPFRIVGGPTNTRTEQAAARLTPAVHARTDQLAAATDEIKADTDGPETALSNHL
jgi:hypothetical protein